MTPYAAQTAQQQSGHARPPHPFVVAADALEPVIRALPKSAWDAAREQEIAKLGLLRGHRFAAIIDWALRERLHSPAKDCKAGCGRKASAKGYCNRCYVREYRAGRR